MLWSKLTAVLEMPNMLDSIHHGTSVEVWALTKAFGFEVLVWSTDVDANYWIATMERVTDAEAMRLAELHPHALHLVHQPMGHTGHYIACCGKIGHPLRCGNQHHGCRYGTGREHEPCNSIWV